MFSEQDHFRHTAPEGMENWQESWVTSWFDPLTQTGAYHHVDFQPERGKACVQSWFAEHGQVLSRYQSLNIPMNDYAPDEFDFGPLSVQTMEPLRGYRLSVNDIDPISDGAVRLYDMTFEGFTPAMPLARETASVGPSDYSSRGTGHYEVIGRGEVCTSAGQLRRVFVFHDHSWGPRDYSKLTSTYRWGHFLFAEDLFAVLYRMTNDTGTFCYGYVHDAGRTTRVVDVSVELAVADDGHTPTGATLTAFVESGSGYQITGRTQVSSISTHLGGHFSTETFGTYQLGGRVGGGHLAVRELGRPTPEHLAWLTRHDPVQRETTCAKGPDQA